MLTSMSALFFLRQHAVASNANQTVAKLVSLSLQKSYSTGSASTNENNCGPLPPRNKKRQMQTYVATPEDMVYTLSLLRNNDNENYLANLLQPRAVARAHAAIRSFNIELANIRCNVSNEDLGHMRLLFFRAQFEQLLSDEDATTVTPGSPVLSVLAEAISKFPNTHFSLLHTLIDARDDDMGYPSFECVRELQDFGERTQGTLMHVHASMLGKHGESIAKTAQVAGAAVGLAIVLRGAPAHAASRLSYMPRQLLKRYGVAQSEVIRGDGNAIAIFKSVARRARRCLQVAKRRATEVDSDIRGAFWPLIMADMYLGRLARAGDNPFDARLVHSLKTTYALALQLRLVATRLGVRKL